MKAPRRIVVFVILSVLILGGLCAAYYAESCRTLNHFEVVDPGKLYRSGVLPIQGLEKVYAATGFKTIVNLRTEAERKQGSWYREEREFTLTKNILLVDLPMAPDTPPKADQIRCFLTLLADPSRIPVLVHCDHGVIRTGMMVAVYQVAVQKKDNRRVLADLPMFGHSFDDRPAAKDFILNYRPEADVR